jgi:hypothetical protein
VISDSPKTSNLISGFPVIGVDRIVKRTLMSTAGVAVFGAAAAILLGQPFVAPGLVIGLAMALVNHRVFQSSAMRFTSEEGTVRRRPFAGSVFLRLGACTAVVALLLVFARPVGWGALGGLAVFQALLLINAIVALIGYQRAEGGTTGA